VEKKPPGGSACRAASFSFDWNDCGMNYDLRGGRPTVMRKNSEVFGKEFLNMKFSIETSEFSLKTKGRFCQGRVQVKLSVDAESRA
jgi:hypothetical protein